MIARRQFQQIFFLGLVSTLKGCSALDNSPLKQNSRSANSELFILWERGYLSEENQGILHLSEEWVKKSGKKINLKLVSDDFIEQSLLEFLKNPNDIIAPDLVFSITFNSIVAPLLAWQDKLLDLSDLIQPIASSFNPDVLNQVLYRNQIRKDRRYYALPIGQADAYIHYWQDTLAEIGYREADIPREWDKFWTFWQTAQTKLRSPQHPDLYGLGLCLSANGFDTAAAFELFLDAYNVQIATHDRGLVLADTPNRERTIEIVTKLADFYRQDYIPPDALEWTGSGNNIAFLNHRTLMTVNMTLSIPRSQKLENSIYNQKAAQRYRNIGTLITYPNKLDGTPLQPPRVISQILALKHGQHHSQDTLDFLSYVLKPDNIQRLVQGFNGRILPTMPQLLQDPLWQSRSDPHSLAALAIYKHPRPFDENKLHPIRSQIDMQQLWSQIIQKTIQNQMSPTQATDWGIAQIRQFWEKIERKI